MDRSQGILRRSLVIAGAASAIAPSFGSAQPQSVLTKLIPSTGEALPLIRLGTWITFNIGRVIEARDSCTEVLRAFFAAGGRLIDSSPMYGSSQEDGWLRPRQARSSDEPVLRRKGLDFVGRRGTAA